MRSHRDYYIHELTIDTILNILENSAWKVADQSISSANTDNNDQKEPDAQLDNTSSINAFIDITFDLGIKKIVDIGGGKFDYARHFLKREKNIELLVWDPYNRSKAHNDNIQDEIKSHPVNTATSMSVLNVIPEPAARLAHINTLKAALMIGGKAYFKIWPGKHPLGGTYLPSASESCYQANAHADRFLREIECVFGIGNVKLDDTIPNLIIAIKTTESPTTRQAIAHIQKKSLNELAILTRAREKWISYLYANLLFFKKIENEFIKQNRHATAKLQHEYDKRFGLVSYKK